MTKEMFDRIRHVLVNSEQGSSAYDVACYALWHAMTGPQREVLGQLIKYGPVWDGEVASKSARDDLIHIGLAGRAVINGQTGFTVANYIGWDVYQTGAMQ